jgi:hypothetical protein
MQSDFCRIGAEFLNNTYMKIRLQSLNAPPSTHGLSILRAWSPLQLCRKSEDGGGLCMWKVLLTGNMLVFWSLEFFLNNA